MQKKIKIPTVDAQKMKRHFLAMADALGKRKRIRLDIAMAIMFRISK